MTQYVTDGGLETDLIFHHGADLPEFAAFPLVEDEDGRALLTRYYDGYAAIAAQAGVGLLLEAPTWRANPDWAAKVGYDAAALDRVNRAAVELMQGLREKYGAELGLTEVKVGGLTGPRGDGYVAGEDADPDEAAEYHAAPGPGAGRRRGRPDDRADVHRAPARRSASSARCATRDCRSRSASPSRPTAGCPTGPRCATPSPASTRRPRPTTTSSTAPTPPTSRRGWRATDGSYGLWLSRIEGLRPNASRMSHAELDEAPELDEGDPADLAARSDDLRAHAAQPARRRRLLRHRQPPRRRAVGCLTCSSSDIRRLDRRPQGAARLPGVDLLRTKTVEQSIAGHRGAGVPSSSGA